MTPILSVRMGLVDNSNERSSANFHLDDTIVASTEFIALFTGTGPYITVRNAIKAVTDMAHEKSTSSHIIETPAEAVPTDTTAQREHILRLELQDVVNGKKFRMDIPGAAESSLRTSGTDAADFSSGALQTLKNAIEGNCLSPYGNGVSVLSGRFTGKNT